MKNKKSKIKRVISVIEYIIIFMVIAVNAILVVKSVNNSSKTPDILGKKAFVIISGSMIPEIQIGDVVVVQNADKIDLNQIIAYRNNSTVIVHRVINQMEIDGKIMYQTKGDNNNIPDTELVDFSKIEGVYCFKIPYIGNILMFLYNNLAIVIIAIVLIFIIKYFFSSKDEDEKEK